MSIIASTPEPASSRPIDPDTLAAIRADLPERVAELQSTYPVPLSAAEVARRLGVTEAEVVAASIPAPRQGGNAGRWPMNPAHTARVDTTPAVLADAPESFKDGYAHGYADALGRVVARPAVDQGSDRELVDLIELALSNNPEAVRRLAAACRLPGVAGKLAIEQVARDLGVFPAAPCPAWCDRDHAGEVVEVDGFTLGTVHERVLAEVTADHAAWCDRPATASVYVERSDERGLVVTPTRVVLCVAEGAEGVRAGTEDTEGWAGTPEQAEALAEALLAGARVVRAGAGTAYRVDVYDANDVLLTSREVTAADDRAALTAAGSLVDELGGAALAAVFTTGPAGVLVYVDSVSR
ncbi:hypothetical protein [Micromonospora sp. DT62]|uniref:hypothetical protein n=1 Tax=Micromonospora sp. DT62 TaxID=3416521 RepID=UPI003CE69E55